MNYVLSLTDAQGLALFWTAIGFIILMTLVILYFLFAFIALKKVLRPVPRTEEDSYLRAVEQKAIDKEFFNVPFEEMWADSDFGYKMFARFYKNEVETDRFIILLHGHASNGVGVLVYAKEFLRLGFNVLVPDQRGTGKSGGKGHTMGHYEKFDAVKWLDLLESGYPNAQIGVFGESMGGATAVMLTALDNRVKFLIEYSAYSHFENVIKSYLKKKGLFNFLIFGLRVVASGVYSVDFRETHAVPAMKQITVPTLIMHSKGDALVLYNNALELKEANPNAELITFEKSPHARSIAHYPEQYKEALENFINKFVNRES
jgi:hypothetical protein